MLGLISSAVVVVAPFLFYLGLFRYNAQVRSWIYGLKDEEEQQQQQMIIPNCTWLPAIDRWMFGKLPHLFLSQRTWPVLDVAAAIPYLAHFFLPLAFSLYLVQVRGWKVAGEFIWCAGWVNLLALGFQTTCPTAPPWFADTVQVRYMEKEDDNKNLRCLESFGCPEGGFARLDTLLGITFFKRLYACSPVKYGAMPSLHMAWPTLILLLGPWVSIKFAWMHIGWVAWAGMYSHHHYAIDMLMGFCLPVGVYAFHEHIYSPF